MVNTFTINAGLGKNMQKKTNTKGFTLIELLVVIAIIALLLSILIPALNKVKEQAKFVVGGNNIKQVVLAEMMYTTENDGGFTYAMDCFGLSYLTYTPPSGSWQCTWHSEEDNIVNNPDREGLLWTYLENEAALMCPSYNSLANVEGSEHTGHNPAIPIEPQYAFSQNAFLGNPDENDSLFDWTTPYLAKKVSHIRRPSEIFVFTEENFGPIHTSYGYDLDWARSSLNDTALFPWWGVTNANPAIGEDGIGSIHKSNRGTPEGKQKGVAHAVFADGHFDVLHPWQTQSMGSPNIKKKELPH